MSHSDIQIYTVCYTYKNTYTPVRVLLTILTYKTSMYFIDMILEYNSVSKLTDRGRRALTPF